MLENQNIYTNIIQQEAARQTPFAITFFGKINPSINGFLDQLTFMSSTQPNIEFINIEIDKLKVFISDIKKHYEAEEGSERVKQVCEEAVYTLEETVKFMEKDLKSKEELGLKQASSQFNVNDNSSDPEQQGIPQGISKLRQNFANARLTDQAIAFQALLKKEFAKQNPKKPTELSPVTSVTQLPPIQHKTSGRKLI